MKDLLIIIKNIKDKTEKHLLQKDNTTLKIKLNEEKQDE